MPSDAAKEARFVANPDLETEGTTPLPEDAVTKLRTQLQSETDLLLRKVQHGLLRGGGTDVYTGYSGVALFFLKLADVEPNARFKVILEEGASEVEETALQIAKRYADTSVNLLASATPSNNDTAFLTSPSLGAVAVSSAVELRLGQPKLAEERAHQVLVSASRSDATQLTKTSSEFLYGRAGLLYTLRFLETKCHSSVPDTEVRRVFDSTISDGIRTASDSSFRTLSMRLGVQSFPPLMWRFYSKFYLGAAHGVAGILTELLHHPNLLETPISHYLGQDADPEDTVGDYIWETVTWLIGFLQPNLPSSLDSMKDTLVQWCHGAPGLVILLCKVLQVYGPDRGVEEALRKCGEVIWEKGLLKKGVGLCHGIAGNAYALLQIYKATNDEKYFDRAVRFALFARDWQARTESGEFRHPDHIWSLFEGSSGYATLLTDLLRLFADRNAPLGFPCQTDLPDSQVQAVPQEPAPVATGL